MPLSPNQPLDIPEEAVRPDDYGLLAWNFNPYPCSTTTTTRLNTAGRLNCFTVPIRYPITVTNVHVYITATPTALTSGQCGVALYDNGGSLLGSLVTGVHTDWGTTGWKTHALASGPFKITSAGPVTVALWYNGTTAPGLFRDSSGALDMNLGLTGINTRQALADTGRTTSAPSTLGTKTPSGPIPFFIALS